MAEYKHNAEIRARRAAAMRRFRATEKGKIQIEKAEQKRRAIPRTDEIRAEEAAYAREYRKTPGGQASRKRADKRYAAKVKQYREENYEEVRAKERAFEQELKARDVTKFLRDACERSLRYRERYPLKGWSVASIAAIRHRKRGSRVGGASLTSRDLQDLFQEQGGLCALTGANLKIAPGKACVYSASVDRIDPEAGYHRHNVRIVTMQANAAKWTGTDEQLIAFCRDLLRHSDPDLVGFCRSVLEES